MSDIHDELEASLAARQEVGRRLEPQLVERFVDRIEDEIDRRIDAKLARTRRGPPSGVPVAVPLGSLGLAIPLLGVAGGTAHLAGVIAVCVAIVLVNYLFYLSHRG